MPVSDATYEQVVLEDPHSHWELHCARLVEKPPMTAFHADVIDRLYRRIVLQLSEADFAIRADAGRLRRGTGSYYEADLCVVPRSLVNRQKRERPHQLEVYDEPLPLVVEVWSPSIGSHDVVDKIPEYQARGDIEIWRLHPFERTLTAWRRQPDGAYVETVHRGGTIEPIALLDVKIVIDELFDSE
ncbi:MAG: Uma2 family endonuclease [Dehalococcoidia bacterium]